jgi:hypothetical protein
MMPLFHYRRVASLDGDKLRVSYYLSRSETWPDKKGVASLDGDKLRVSYYLSRSETWPDKKGVQIKPFIRPDFR